MKKIVKAYAKINLFLDIESRREDGYHNILSHMQSITLHDLVCVEYLPSDSKHISVTCDNQNVPCDKRNLAYKAAEIFPINSGIINIYIEKHIPMSAGLAGGSADAAAALIALNSLFDDMLTLDELKAMGNLLGADVPFCIEKGACIARGTGNLMEKTSPLPNYPILVARHGDGMSTPEAYAELDKMNNNFDSYIPNSDILNDMLKIFSGGSLDISLCTYNIFESVVEPQRPFVTLIKNIMNENGAAVSMMSGSGTAVFGIFKNEADALKAKIALEFKDINAELCYPYIRE